MPLYRYQCFHCGLNFQLRVSRSKSRDPQGCTSCPEQAQRVLPSSLEHGFTPKIEGVQQPNSGASSIDYDFDRVVALDSQEKWKTVHKRQQAKLEMLRGSSKTGRHLVRSGDSYEMIGDDERDRLDDLRTKIAGSD